MKDPKNKKPLLKKQILLILGPTGAAVLVLLVILLARSFAGKGDATTVSNDQPDTLEAESASAQPETQRFSEPVSLTVSMAGDCTLGKDEAFNYSTSLNAYYDMYGPTYFFQNVKSIFDADDLTVVNFEGTLTDSTERNGETFAFKAPAEYAEILTDGGVNTFPDLEKKADILENAAMCFQALGYETIHAACICGAEQVNPRLCRHEGKSEKCRAHHFRL